MPGDKVAARPFASDRSGLTAEGEKVANKADSPLIYNTYILLDPKIRPRRREGRNHSTSTKSTLNNRTYYVLRKITKSQTQKKPS